MKDLSYYEIQGEPVYKTYERFGMEFVNMVYAVMEKINAMDKPEQPKIHSDEVI